MEALKPDGKPEYLPNAYTMFHIKGFWPGMTYGGPGGLFPGVYETVVDEVSRYNLEHFGVDPFLKA